MSETTNRQPVSKVTTVYGTATHFEDAQGVFCGARAALDVDSDDLTFASCTRCMKIAGFDEFVFTADLDAAPVVINLAHRFN